MTTRTPVGHGIPAALAMLLGIGIAGCAGPGGFLGAANKASPFRDPGMTMQTASDAIVVGQYTKDRVAGVLGPATVVKFDSGFEVWLYRAGSPSEAATKPELVILFAPSGVVKKTRLSPAS